MNLRSAPPGPACMQNKSMGEKRVKHACEAHDWKQRKDVPVGVNHKRTRSRRRPVPSHHIVLKIHSDEGGEHGKRAKENATTGESIGIEATMGISIPKSSSWSNVTINSSMVREGEYKRGKNGEENCNA